MIKNAKKVINTKVFKDGSGSYLGKISDIAISDDGKVSGYYMETDSIVPLEEWICPGAVTKTGKGKMYVSENPERNTSKPPTFKKNISKRDFFKSGIRIGRGKDMIFDSETGEIQGFVCRENIFQRPLFLDVNKIKITGKNIDVKNDKEGL